MAQPSLSGTVRQLKRSAPSVAASVAQRARPERVERRNEVVEDGVVYRVAPGSGHLVGYGGGGRCTNARCDLSESHVCHVSTGRVGKVFLRRYPACWHVVHDVGHTTELREYVATGGEPRDYAFSPPEKVRADQARQRADGLARLRAGLPGVPEVPIAEANTCVEATGRAVTGFGCAVIGNDNTVDGAGNLVVGDRCTVTGDDSIVIGDEATVSGFGAILSGAKIRYMSHDRRNLGRPRAFALCDTAAQAARTCREVEAEMKVRTAELSEARKQAAALAIRYHPSRLQLPAEPAPDAPDGASHGVCNVCATALVDVVFGCGHTICHDCVATLRERARGGTFACPSCRVDVTDAWRLFL
jgi:hypothetical protein